MVQPAAILAEDLVEDGDEALRDALPSRLVSVGSFFSLGWGGSGDR